MSKLSKPIEVETAFGKYMLTDQLGEGGAGRVYGGVADDGAKIALKLLTQSSTDKRRRFKNETNFLSRNRHENIVTVIDHGLAAHPNLEGAFYVMSRYDGSLRALLDNKLSPEDVMPIFSKILNGVEAAHLQLVTHRDLKPENVLCDTAGTKLAIADFGVASFTEEFLHTLVETQPMQRLANFVYAAPEQRVKGARVTAAADVYALGLMLNEMFTGNVPHGTSYRNIASVSEPHSYLDPIVEQMLQSEPVNRPSSIAEIKNLIQRYNAEAVSRQKISQMAEVIIPEGEVDDPLAHEPPKLVGVTWLSGQLSLELDRPVNAKWQNALHNMGSYTSVMGIPPESFRFSGTTARIAVDESSAQSVIDHFKNWLPVATRVHKHQLESELKDEQNRRLRELQLARAAEERNLRLNQSLRI